MNLNDVINGMSDGTGLDYLQQNSYLYIESLRNTEPIKQQLAVHQEAPQQVGVVQDIYASPNAGGRAKQVLDIAYRFRGTPYTYGAPEGVTSTFDCSSFVQYCFKQIGINLPRVASDQARQGKDPGTDLQAADLIFWQGTNPAKSGVTHVGIYIGDSKFIASGRSHGVGFGTLRTPYYKVHYYGARRVL